MGRLAESLAAITVARPDKPAAPIDPRRAHADQAPKFDEVRQQAHDHGIGMPARSDQAAKKTAFGRRPVGMEGLRIVLRGKGDDFPGIHRPRA